MSYKIKWQHTLTKKKRQTLCIITDLNTQEVFTGTAKCHNEDQFNRRLGMKISFKRAVCVFPKRTRTELWKQFLLCSPKMYNI